MTNVFVLLYVWHRVPQTDLRRKLLFRLLWLLTTQSEYYMATPAAPTSPVEGYLKNAPSLSTPNIPGRIRKGTPQSEYDLDNLHREL